MLGVNMERLNVSSRSSSHGDEGQPSNSLLLTEDKLSPLILGQVKATSNNSVSNISSALPVQVEITTSPPLKLNPNFGPSSNVKIMMD